MNTLQSPLSEGAGALRLRGMIVFPRAPWGGVGLLAAPPPLERLPFGEA